MSKADKMFEELGYEKISEERKTTYKNGAKTFDFFCGSIKRILVYETDTEYAGLITPKELQAINEKCREMGWLE